MPRQNLFLELAHAASRPRPFEVYTAERLWADPHISARMLEYHLDPSVDLASRTRESVESSSDWICERFGLGPGVSVADFGCGPGLYANRFAGKGASVTAVDFSPRSIEHARSEAASRSLDVDYVLANYLDFHTDARFDLVTLIFCDLCALGPEQRSAVLRMFGSVLSDGGAVLLDVCSQKAFDSWRESNRIERRLMNGFWAPGDYFGIRFSFKYPQERVTLDKYTIVEPERSWQVYNWLQYYNVDALSKELEGAGLRIAEVYADVAGTPYDSAADQFAVVAVRA